MKRGKKLLKLKAKLLDGETIEVNYLTFELMVNEVFGDCVGDDINVIISGNTVQIKIIS